MGVLIGTINEERLSASYLKNTKSAIQELMKKENVLIYLSALQTMQREELYLDYAKFVAELSKQIKSYGLKGTSFNKLKSTGMLDTMLIADERAEVQYDAQGNVIVDSNYTDTENIPITFNGGIKAYMDQEVLPYHPNAFVNEEKTQIGYEVNFTRYFYKPKQLDSVEVIVERLKELEKQSDGLMANILEGLYE